MMVRRGFATQIAMAVVQFVLVTAWAHGQSPLSSAVPEDFSACVSAWQSVDRWLLEYEARVVVENEAGELGRTVHKTIACAKPDKFFHFMGHGKTWDAEPFNQLAILNGAQSVHMAPFMRRLRVDKTPDNGQLPGTLSQEFAFFIMPMLACSHLHTGNGSTTLVLDAIGADNYRRVDEELVIAGEPCVEWRAVDGTESMWISKSKGPCVMQREHRDPTTGQVVQRIQTFQTRQFSNNLWLPVRFSRSIYRVGEQQPQLLQTSDFRVIRFETDAQVPDSQFAWNYSPGMIQRQASGNWEQAILGGTDLLDTYVNYLQNEVYKPANSQAVQWRGLGGYLVLSVMLVVIALKSLRLVRQRATETINIT